MPRRSLPSTSLLALVRQWFGLTQAELALYLGSSQSLLQAIETGQRRLHGAVAAALLPLAHQLPAPAGPAAAATPDAAPAPPAPAAPPADAALAFRYRQCLAQAARLSAELAALVQAAALAARWAAAAPALAAGVPPALPGSTPAEAATREAWRKDWLLRRASPRPAAEATRATLLRARLAGLHAEAQALAAQGA